MKNSYSKFFVLLLVLLLISNMTLLALGKIKEVLFWIIIVIAAVFAYWILPKIKK